MTEAKQKAVTDSPSAQAHSLVIRPAETRDAAAIAALYVQLWRSELPMLLAGGEPRTQRFLERQLLAEDGRRLRNNFVGEYGGEIVALYGVSTKEDPRPSFWRPGVIRDIVECIGPANVRHVLWPIIRNLITQAGEEWPGTLYISNLVIKRAYRNYGFGEVIFGHYFHQAQERGCGRLAGQVMDPQAAAFYDHMGTVFGIEARSDGPRPRGRIGRRVGVASQILWSDIPRR